MRLDRLSTVDDCVNPVNQQYAVVVRFDSTKISNASFELRGKRAISFPAGAMTNGAAIGILALTNVIYLRIG